MHPTAPQSVFSLPLRHLWSTQFSGDQVTVAQTVKGLSRFVGDAPNASLRYFAEHDLPEPGDWPIVFYGPSGTGKTSLAMSILERLLAPCPTVEFSDESIPNPVFLSAADFMRRFKSAVETDSVAEFRQRLGGGFLIDDLGYLSGHQSAQQELCFLMDQVSGKRRPMIATLDESPLNCRYFCPQLKSRLMNGLCLPVVSPGELARRVVLQDLASIFELEMEPPSLDWLANRLSMTVPKMNHVLAQLKSFLILSGDPNQTVTIEFLKNWFESVTRKSDQVKARQILLVVSREFGFKVSELKGQSRKQTLALARSISMYICREMLGFSFLKIGSLLGNRDHSTVMHSCRKIQAMVDSSPDRPDTKTVIRILQILEEQFNEFQYEDMDNSLAHR